MSKKSFRKILTVVLIGIIIFWLIYLDWNSVFSKNNSGALLGILAPILILISMYLPNKQEKNNS